MEKLGIAAAVEYWTTVKVDSDLKAQTIMWLQQKYCQSDRLTDMFIKCNPKIHLYTENFETRRIRENEKVQWMHPE